MMKTLAIIVVYYPNVEDVTKNILRFIDFVDKVIIWQNTPSVDGKNYLINSFEDNEKVIYMGNGSNMGIAYALNHAFDDMMNDFNQFTHLLTMDQDSTWVNFNDYKGTINISPKDSIYSPNINNEFKQGTGLIKVKTCITSGAVFPIEVLKSIGKFNEIYSVDCVDYDFCFKANRNGINIYKIQGCIMNQVYGAPIKSKYFILETNCYSPKRLFFIARNHILLWRDYSDQLDFQFKKMILNSFIFGKIVKVILMENNKTEKVISILNGFFCGIKNDRRDRY